MTSFFSQHTSSRPDSRPNRTLAQGCRPALFATLVALAIPFSAREGVAQTQAPASDTSRPRSDTSRPKPAAPRKQWWERLSIRGYTQIRYNGLFRTNPNLQCSQCDRSIGDDGGLFIRRARVILSGDVSDRVFIYIQPDFASEVSGNLHYAQIRDAYFDLALDKKKEFRFRFGQSKIPFGFENLQSSSNRLPMDRNDALNSAIPNERDLGVMFYWAPAKIRERFKMLLDSGLKGSGDYGVLGIGAYNGQGANKPEENDNMHGVMRLTYPFQFSNGQIVELGIQGYTGRYVLPSNLRTANLDAPEEFDDSRVAASFIVYPQPFGFQAEWNIGRGPEFDPAAGNTRDRSLSGGYVQTMYRAKIRGQSLIPFVRAHKYDGGKKFEQDARHYEVRELEIGTEWLPIPAFELTAMYTISDRRYEDLGKPDNRQKGQFLRLQAQFNY